MNEPIDQKYDIAIDALVESCKALNEGNPKQAHEIIRRALWTMAEPHD